MDKNIIIGSVVVVAIGGAILVGSMSGNKNTSPENQTKSPCSSICQKANKTCPSLINEENCNKNCSKLSEEAKKHLQESKDCQQITSKPDLIVDLLVPETATPKPVDKNASECEAACGSYTGKCLTLVPNLTEAMLEDGMKSCMQECASWDTKKIDCMINAFDCESFTNVCGL